MPGPAPRDHEHGIDSDVVAGPLEAGGELLRCHRHPAQSEFVKQVSETVQIGLGALVDADMAKETANLQALQVRQQLGVQALGIANQAPQSLLGLLR